MRKNKNCLSGLEGSWCVYIPLHKSYASPSLHCLPAPFQLFLLRIQCECLLKAYCEEKYRVNNLHGLNGSTARSWLFLRPSSIHPRQAAESSQSRSSIISSFSLCALCYWQRKSFITRWHTKCMTGESSSPYRKSQRIRSANTGHYVTLHYITLHYITLHYITLHYIK